MDHDSRAYHNPFFLFGFGMRIGIVDNHDVFFPFFPPPKSNGVVLGVWNYNGGRGKGKGKIKGRSHESCESHNVLSFPKFQRCRFESGSWSFMEPRNVFVGLGFCSLFVHFLTLFIPP